MNEEGSIQNIVFAALKDNERLLPLTLYRLNTPESMPVRLAPSEFYRTSEYICEGYHKPISRPVAPVQNHA